MWHRCLLIICVIPILPLVIIMLVIGACIMSWQRPMHSFMYFMNIKDPHVIILRPVRPILRIRRSAIRITLPFALARLRPLSIPFLFSFGNHHVALIHCYVLYICGSEGATLTVLNDQRINACINAAGQLIPSSLANELQAWPDRPLLLKFIMHGREPIHAKGARACPLYKGKGRNLIIHMSMRK